MKKWVKVTLIALVSIFVVVTLLVLWQWKNIRSIYIGINESPEEITRRRNENQVKLAEELEKYLDGSIRTPTPEEKKKIESGEVMAGEVYKQIFEEKYVEITGKEPATKSADSVNSEKSEKLTKDEKPSGKDKTTSSEKTKASEKSSNSETKVTSKDEIVVRYMNELYSLQSEYTAKAEVTIKEGAHYYETQKDIKDKTAARADTISHFTPKVRALEAECDKRVETIITNMKNELQGIGADIGIINSIRETYATEKQLKLSYYANKYLN